MRHFLSRAPVVIVTVAVPAGGPSGLQEGLEVYMTLRYGEGSRRSALVSGPSCCHTIGLHCCHTLNAPSRNA